MISKNDYYTQQFHIQQDQEQINKNNSNTPKPHSSSPSITMNQHSYYNHHNHHYNQYNHYNNHNLQQRQISQQFCDKSIKNINEYKNNSINYNNNDYNQNNSQYNNINIENINLNSGYFFSDNEIIYSNYDTLIIINKNGEIKSTIKCNDRINSFTINEKRTLGATSQYHFKDMTSTISIWDLVTLKQISTILVPRGYNEIFGLKFSTDSTRVVGLANDEKFTLFLWDIKSRSMVISSPNTNRVYGVSFNPFNMYSMITYGEKHINFWCMNDTMISKKRAIFGKELQMINIYSCYIHSYDTFFFGTSNGHILIFKNNNLIQLIRLYNNSPIYHIIPNNNDNERKITQSSTQQLIQQQQIILQQQQQQTQPQTQQNNYNNNNNNNNINNNNNSTQFTNMNITNYSRKSGFYITFENYILYFSPEDSFKNPKSVSLGNPKYCSNSCNSNGNSNSKNNNLIDNSNNNNNDIYFIDSYDDKIILVDNNNDIYHYNLNYNE